MINITIFNNVEAYFEKKKRKDKISLKCVVFCCPFIINKRLNGTVIIVV